MGDGLSFLDQFVFGVYPYICITIFVGATLYRFEKEPYTWQASSSQMMRKKHFAWSSNLFHIGILNIAVGHAVGLLVPASVFHFFHLPDDAHQMMELWGGGVFGVCTLLGLLVLTYRRVVDSRVRKTSDSGDLPIAVLLLVVLAVGLATMPHSYETRASGEYLHALANWAQHIVTLRPSVHYLADVPDIYKFHMFAGMTVFLIFPFTRLVHVCSAPIGYILRTSAQIVRLPRNTATTSMSLRVGSKGNSPKKGRA